MHEPQTRPLHISIAIVCFLSLTFSQSAMSQTSPGSNAQALLEEARKGELERRIAAKRTEMDRLNEDLSQGRQQADGLLKNIESVTSSATESSAKIDQLAAQKKQATHTLELVGLLIEAERLKGEGLKLLKTAQLKAREALVKRNEETDLRITLAATEMKLLSLQSVAASEQPDPKDKNAKKPLTVSELRKKLAQAQRDTTAASTAAREAMDIATLRLQQADSATAKAKKKATEVGHAEGKGLSSENDPPELSAALPGPLDPPAGRISVDGKF